MFLKQRLNGNAQQHNFIEQQNKGETDVTPNAAASETTFPFLLLLQHCLTGNITSSALL